MTVLYIIFNGFSPETAKSWIKKFKPNSFFNWKPDHLFAASNEPQEGFAAKFTSEINIRNELYQQNLYIRITPENFENIKNQIENLTNNEKQRLKKKLHLLTVCDCNFNNRNSSYQENSPEIRESAVQATEYTNEILKMLGQEPKDTEVRVFGFSTGALLASYCKEYFSETYEKTTLIDVCLAPWNWYFGEEERAKILGKNGQPPRGKDGAPMICAIAIGLTEEEVERNLNRRDPFDRHLFLLQLLNEKSYGRLSILEELFNNLAKLPTGNFFRLSLKMLGDKVAETLDEDPISITASNFDPLKACRSVVNTNRPIEFQDQIDRDFARKIQEIVKKFLLDNQVKPGIFFQSLSQGPEVLQL